MKLITEEIKKILPRFYEQDEKNENAIIYIKFFTPDSSFTWYVLEGEEYKDDFEFFGIVDSGEYQEYGYFKLSELKTVRGALGLCVERDLYFKLQKVSEIKSLKHLWD